jgi:hypothetical protein
VIPAVKIVWVYDGQTLNQKWGVGSREWGVGIQVGWALLRKARFGTQYLTGSAHLPMSWKSIGKVFSLDFLESGE